MQGLLTHTDVSRLLGDTRTLSRSNRAAAVVYLVRKLGIEELFRAYTMQEFDKESAHDLNEGEIEMACAYVDGISRLIDSSLSPMVQ